MIYRHGDLLLISATKKEGLKNIFKGKEYVLKYGETTGHSHKLKVLEPITEFEVLEDEKGEKYLKIGAESQLTHEEHKPLTILPDFYVVKEEKEYDYPAEEIKRVAD
jgi:hypothetical protein